MLGPFGAASSDARDNPPIVADLAVEEAWWRANDHADLCNSGIGGAGAPTPSPAPDTAKAAAAHREQSRHRCQQLARPRSQCCRLRVQNVKL
jgi:hypothetical protein